jgi:hypothetical protein
MTDRELIEAYVEWLRDQRSQLRAVPTWMIQNPRIIGQTSEAMAYMDGLVEGRRLASQSVHEGKDDGQES